jgi:hypothetical protein
VNGKFLNLVKTLRQVNYALKFFNGIPINWGTLEALIPSDILKKLLKDVV